MIQMKPYERKIKGTVYEFPGVCFIVEPKAVINRRCRGCANIVRDVDPADVCSVHSHFYSTKKIDVFSGQG